MLVAYVSLSISAGSGILTWALEQQERPKLSVAGRFDEVGAAYVCKPGSGERRRWGGGGSQYSRRMHTLERERFWEISYLILYMALSGYKYIFAELHVNWKGGKGWVVSAMIRLACFSRLPGGGGGLSRIVAKFSQC